MLNVKIQELINEQINKEMYSAYLYLNISNFYAEKGLNGFASWFKKQAGEEVEHAMKFVNYMHSEGAAVTLKAIDGPTQVFNDLKDPLDFQLTHERSVTSWINAIYKASLEVNDYRTTNFLNWFINEQAEEESNAADLIAMYDIFAVQSKALYKLDEKLGSRK